MFHLENKMYSYYDEMQASALQLWTRVQELQIKASVLQILARAQEAKANSNVTLLAEVSVSRVLGVFGLGVLVVSTTYYLLSCIMLASIV